MVTVYWYLNFVTGEICQCLTPLEDSGWGDWVLLKRVTE